MNKIKKNENYLTPEQEQRLIEISNETLRTYYNGEIKAYKSAREMFEDILSE